MKCKSNDWAVQLMLSWAMLLVVVPLCSQSAGAGSSSSSPRLKVATCQFPVSGDVDENARYVKGFIKKASVNKADIVHFSEAALSGYARVDFPDFDGYDWEKLRTHTQEITGHRQVIPGQLIHGHCPERKKKDSLFPLISLMISSKHSTPDV